MQTPSTTEDLLTFEDDYVRAEAGKRFLNYLIDTVVFYIVYFVILFILMLIFPSLRDLFAEDDGMTNLVDRLLTLVFYATYMGFIETLFKGKSVGKMITGTRAVNLDGTMISANTAFQLIQISP